MKLNCKRIDLPYTPGEEIFTFPEDTGLPFLFDVEEELTADPAAMDAVGEMLDETEKLAEKAKAAIKAALADEDSRYHSVVTFFMEFHRDDVGPDIAAELFPGTDPSKLSFAEMVDFLKLKRFGSLVDDEMDQQVFIMDLSFNPEITDELIETIKNEEKVCHYLDIPIQHASDAILKRMGRRTSNKEIRELVAKLRREIPDIALRTTFISGFPGETEEDHEILMEFVDDMEFDRLGVFAYSPEEDTPAYSFKDQVPDEVKEERRAEIMELQQDIAFEKSESMKGSVLEVMIEGKVADENAYVGRTYMDSPGVDGLIFVNTGLSLMSGDFVRVRVTGALEYDLIGEVEDEFTE